MAGPNGYPEPDVTALTPRQRRLRVWTFVILAAVAAMVVCGVTAPFFRMHHAPITSPLLRKAVATQAIMVLGYWTVCFLLTCTLMALAWLDLREVQKKLALARAMVLREMARESEEKRKRKEQQ